MKTKKNKKNWKLKPRGKFFCVNLRVQWLAFCNKLYIVGEATNMHDLGRYLNLNGWLKYETKFFLKKKNDWKIKIKKGDWKLKLKLKKKRMLELNKPSIKSCTLEHTELHCAWNRAKCCYSLKNQTAFCKQGNRALQSCCTKL